eukprot:4331698-Prymnesium_polylepis.1
MNPKRNVLIYCVSVGASGETPPSSTYCTPLAHSPSSTAASAPSAARRRSHAPQPYRSATLTTSRSMPSGVCHLILEPGTSAQATGTDETASPSRCAT